MEGYQRRGDNLSKIGRRWESEHFGGRGFRTATRNVFVEKILVKWEDEQTETRNYFY